MKRALVVLVSNQKVAELASTQYHVPRPQILEDRIPNFKDGRIEVGQERGTGTIKRKNDGKFEEFKIAVIALFRAGRTYCRNHGESPVDPARNKIPHNWA